MLGKHLLGLYEKALPDHMSLPEKFRCAKSLGFDYMEISIDESDARLSRLYMPEREQLDLGRELRATGLGLQSLCLSAHRRFPFGSAQAPVRDKAMEIMERAIIFAKNLGIAVIQLAAYDVYYEPARWDSPRLFLEGLEEACRMAAAHQLMLALETMDTPFLNSVSKYLKLKAQLPCPWLAVYPDIGNLSAWPENDVLRELELGLSDTVAVHIKETRPVWDASPCFKGVDFGSGCVDFLSVFARLEALGYSGPYTLEMWHRGGETCAQVSQALDFLLPRFAQALGSWR